MRSGRDIGGVAAAGQAAEFGQVARGRQDELALVRPRRARPADHLVGRQHVQHHRGGRPRRDDALDPVGNRDPPAGRVLDLAGGQPGGQQGRRQNKRLPQQMTSSMPVHEVRIPLLPLRDP
jgi:hypothetical protein